MTREALLNDLRTLPPDGFLESHLFDRVPAVFQGDRTLYIQWKRELANQIEVDPACFLLVGTAATGISLNPTNNFKPFDENSDIDVAVVSHHHFNEAWRYLRLNGARRLTIDTRTRNAWDEHVKRYVYWGTIATDRLLGVLPFGLQWLKATTHMAQVNPTEGREINLRLYADFDSLRIYQTIGVRIAREALAG